MPLEGKSKGGESPKRRVDNDLTPTEKETDKHIDTCQEFDEIRKNATFVEDICSLHDYEKKEDGKNDSKFDIWNVRFLELQVYKKQNSSCITKNDTMCYRDRSKENEINAWLKRY